MISDPAGGCCFDDVRYVFFIKGRKGNRGEGVWSQLRILRMEFFILFPIKYISGGFFCRKYIMQSTYDENVSF